MSAAAQRHRRRSERGQTIIIFGLTLSLFLFGMIALVADLSVLFAAKAQVSRAAQSAAIAGAADVDISAFLNGTPSSAGGLPPGTVRLLPSSSGSTPPASAVCTSTATGALAGAVPTCTYVDRFDMPVNANNATRMRATVTLAVNLPIRVPGFPTPVVSASYSAFAQRGTVGPQ